MMTVNPRDLPGFKKKSFSMAFGGGEIWFEHLDGIYGNKALVIEKLNTDRPSFCRPSVTSLIAFVLDETDITPEVLSALADAIMNSPKRFYRVCFIGTDKKSERAIKKSLTGKTFALAFINDLEKAKEWLVGESI